MIIKLDGSRKKADGKGFDRKDVKAMVQEYRAPQTHIDPILYKEIASDMGLSPRTVDNYREALFAKLNIKSRTGLVVYGIKTGLIKI